MCIVSLPFSQEDPNQPNLRDEVELLEPALLENNDDVTV